MNSITLLVFVFSFTTIFSLSQGGEIFNESEKFLYFAYGSNLLEKRIHIKNPSAKFFSAAKLSGHRLDFNIFDPNWNGAVATIVEDVDKNVWGSLWILDIADMKNLDDQEDVAIGFYYAKNVTVTTPDGNVFEARTYPEVEVPPKVPSYELPLERQPSDTYMQVIIYGAFESRLPMHYLRFLFSFPTNGKVANSDIRQKLGRPFNETEPY